VNYCLAASSNNADYQQAGVEQVHVMASGFVIPNFGISFNTTVGSANTTLQIYPGALDSNSNLYNIETLIPGSSVQVKVMTSQTCGGTLDQSIGLITLSPVVFKGADDPDYQTTSFQPLSSGSDVIYIPAPTGFKQASNNNCITANVSGQSSNLFSLSNIAVTSNSSLNSCGFVITSIFQGGPPSTCASEGDAQDVIFADQAPGAVDTVQFSTATPVTLSIVRLVVNGDGPPANNRDLAQFTLSYESSPGVYTAVATYSPTHPEPNTVVLNLSAPITAQNFRAQFTQYGSDGPRVSELDGF
jgi:hypothetical protein